MPQNDVMQVRVESFSVGTVGFKQVMEEMGQQYVERPDEEVRNELLKRLSRTNYIPEKAKDRYAKAFLREFKKFLGGHNEEEFPEGMEIKVLGPGCYQCDKLEQDLMAVMAELDLKGAIEHVRDIKQIGKYGVMGMPALIINGKVKSVGKVPPKSKLVEWLTEAKD